ncbi:MAG: thioredoxin [Candidatus Muiribacterium halophilum]|uniref:Thioredoxin n=1 Tax=Muiribacterium halophilum TaxID=2053465 RepID=A0A2N5ZIM9_MUIH1|nr:MAG: thioredoxin [Candidatus Muirbacterium halophilum]
MEKIINLNSQNFNEVLQTEDKLIVLDFWAPWCGPCKMLGPVLEKLTHEYDFILAKVNTEENPDIAKFYKISSIPDVRFYKNMQEVDKFIGAKPEPAIRKLLDKHVRSNADKKLDELKSEISSLTSEEQENRLRELLKNKNINDKALLIISEIYLKLEKTENVKKTLKKIKSFETEIVNKKEFLFSQNEILLDSKNKYETSKASKLFLEGKFETAFETLLSSLEDAKNKKESHQKEMMVHMFTVLGNKDPLTNEYRVKLSRMLY